MVFNVLIQEDSGGWMKEAGGFKLVVIRGCVLLNLYRIEEKEACLIRFLRVFSLDSDFGFSGNW
jgi:hypothetical protein